MNAITIPNKITIKPEKVTKVYSGRPGCMCGCRGIYRYPKTATLESIKKYIGYQPDPKTINDHFVKSVILTVSKSLEEGICKNVSSSKDHLYVEINGRAYCIYFN